MLVETPSARREIWRRKRKLKSKQLSRSHERAGALTSLMCILFVRRGHCDIEDSVSAQNTNLDMLSYHVLA